MSGSKGQCFFFFEDTRQHGVGLVPPDCLGVPCLRLPSACVLHTLLAFRYGWRAKGSVILRKELESLRAFKIARTCKTFHATTRTVQSPTHRNVELFLSFQSDIHPFLPYIQAAPAASATSALGTGAAGLKGGASTAPSGSSSSSLPQAPKAFRVVSCHPTRHT